MSLEVGMEVFGCWKPDLRGFGASNGEFASQSNPPPLRNSRTAIFTRLVADPG